MLDLVYVAYVAALLVACAVAIAAYGVSVVDEAFRTLGQAGQDFLIGSTAVALPALLGFAFARYVCTSPLRMTPAELTYVGASPVSNLAIVFVAVAKKSLVAMLAGGAIGAVLGVAFRGSGAAIVPFVVCVAGALIGILLAVVSTTTGILRLVPASRVSRLPLLCVAACFVLTLVSAANVMRLTSSTGIMLRAMDSGDHALAMIGVLGVLIACSGLALAAAVSKASRTALLHATAEFAELQPMRQLRHHFPTEYRDAVERRHLARRGPRPRMRRGSGASAMVCRSVVSFVRRPHHVARVLFWSAAVVPLGVVVLLRHPGPSAGLWLAVAISSATQDLARVFDDDMRNRALRTLMPFDTLRLLVLDSSAAIIVGCVASAVALVGMRVPGLDMLSAITLATSLNITAVLCRGLGRLKLPFIRRETSAELATLIAFGAVVLVSLSGQGAAVAVAAVLVALLAGAAVKLSSE